MCISFDPAWIYDGNAELVDAATRIEQAHDGVTCAAQHYILRHYNSTSVICSMQVESDTSAMVMFPIQRMCLGSNDKFLRGMPVGGDKYAVLKCQQSNLDAIINVGDYVKKPTGSYELHYPNTVMYRSCGADDDGTVPMIPLGACVHNPDGSITFVLKTADQWSNGEETLRKGT